MENRLFAQTPPTPALPANSYFSLSTYLFDIPYPNVSIKRISTLLLSQKGHAHASYKNQLSLFLFRVIPVYHAAMPQFFCSDG